MNDVIVVQLDFIACKIYLCARAHYSFVSVINYEIEIFCLLKCHIVWISGRSFISVFVADGVHLLKLLDKLKLD